MADIKLEPALDIDFQGNPGLKHFETLADIENFVNGEATAWAPVFKAAQDLGQRSQGNYSAIIYHQQQTIQNTRNQVSQQRTATKDRSIINSAPFAGILSPFSNRSVIHSQSVLGRCILGEAKLSPEGAIALFLTVPTYPGRNSIYFQTPQGNFQIAPLVGGIIRAELLQRGFSADEQKARLDTIANEGQKLTADYQREASLAREQREEMQSKGLALLEDQKKAIDEAARLFTEQRTKHDTELENIRASFNEQMKLRAPRLYWASKKSRHRWIGLAWSVGFWLLAIGSVFFLYRWGHKLIEFAKAPSSAIPGAEWVLVVVPALIALWLLRFLHRQATANLTLMNDADERVTMLETYLSLVAEGKIDPVERPLVLQPLFRSTAASAGEEGMIKGLAEHAIDILGKKP